MIQLKLKSLWLLIGYVLVAFVVLQSLTSSPVDVGIKLWDKFLHTAGYFVLMGWFAQLYHAKKLRIIYALSFVAMGVAMEYVQSFDPARMAEFADMVANASGVLLALLITRIIAFRLVLKKVESFI